MKRIVIKIGTSTLTHKTGLINIRKVEKLCRVISDLKNAGYEIVMVSSGAVAMGVGCLSLSERPKETAVKQAVAAVGQCELMYVYDELFTKFNHKVAQILITESDVENAERLQNFHNTLTELFKMNIIPIINENDTLSTKEFCIGDNDTLSAIVAEAVKADLLILLSDIDGLFTADPRKNPDAKLIAEVKEITPEIEALAGTAGSQFGTGGMETKIRAAKKVTAAGTAMIIANGEDPEILYDIVEGKKIGTKFLPCKEG